MLYSYNMTTKRIKISAICLLTCGMFLTFQSNVSLAKEEVGFFYNDKLQSALLKKLNLTHEDKKYPIALENFVSTKNVLIPKEGYHSEIENFSYCEESLRGLEFCALTQPLSTVTHRKKGAIVYVHKEKIDEYLKTISEKIHKEPENGKFEMTADGQLKVLKMSTIGQELDVEASSWAIVDLIKNVDNSDSVPLVVSMTEPEISTEYIKNLGITELIGHGESNFRGSPRNRIHNIKVSTSKYNGYIIKPGEEFSFTEILGPVDSSTGYKEELVIKENKTIPEFGGGVCQVSTTMFRVAINTGLKITERHNHAYPVQYYSPQGTDATVYLPNPDLKFLNDTPNHILIQASIKGTILSFNFYGTSDGRQVEIDGPTVTQRTPDGKMRTVLYQIIKDASGAIRRKDTFNSLYDNPAKYHEPKFTSKPGDWSSKQWDAYKAEHGL